MPGRDWSQIEAPADPPLLILCERAYAAGNNAAIAKAHDECARLGIPSPAWLNDAIKAQTEEAIDPKQARAAGAQSRILDRVEGDHKHLYRMVAVVTVFIWADKRGERISNGEAYRRAAEAIADHLREIDEPVRAVEFSYKKALKLIADERERDFIGPYFSPQVMLRCLAAAQYFASTSPSKK